MAVAWDKQQTLKDAGLILTQMDILNTAKTIVKERDRALFLLTYLTAGRISEVLAIRAEDIQPIFKDGREAIVINMPNRKNRKRHRKDIPIPTDRTLEKEMVSFITSYALGKQGLIFPFSAVTAWLIFRKIGFNPHWLRHIRLTHMETVYGLSPERLRNYAGWTDSRPAKSYVELNYMDILDGM
jgi:integrase